MADRITDEDVRSIGWNSIEHDNPTGNARQFAQQLYYIGLLLVDIRDELDPPADTIIAETAPEKVRVYEPPDYEDLKNSEQIDCVSCAHCQGDQYREGRRGVKSITFGGGTGMPDPQVRFDYVHVRFDRGAELVLEREHCEIEISDFGKPIR